MLSGKLAVGGISLEFGNAKDRFEELSTQLSELTRREDQLLENRRRIFQTLAQLYLPELSREAVAIGLSDLKDEMVNALAAQADNRRRLEERLADLPEIVSQQEFMLAQADRAEESAARGLETVRTAVEHELSENKEHVAAVAEHRTVIERRSILAARRMRLTTTASVERRRYDGDKAFAYLKARGYGEAGYRAGFLTRRLDGWLARRTDFERLDHNYRILREGPKVLQLELRDLTDRASALEARIDHHEEKVGERHGLSSALAAGASAQERLMEARVGLSEARDRYDRVAAEIRAVDAHRGRAHEDALAKHRDFLESRTIKELVELARATPDPKDDGLVSRLEKTTTELTEVGRELRPLREQLEAMNHRATGLGDLLRRATRHFSSRRSYFSEEMNLPRLISSILDGTTNADDAFSRLASTHVKQPLLSAESVPDADGWFADLSARFDKELGAVEVISDQADHDSEVIVYDNHGRVLHRRVTRRSST